MSHIPLERLNAALEGRYAVVRELGQGGMAAVFLADDLKHGRKVALKVLKPELAAVVGADRFLAEIKTTANLHHPHILPLFDSGEADSFLFYVMPFVEGETLRDRLDRERQLPVDEAVSIATAVANALQHAHDRDVIHRDIKPANILLQDGQPVVADFGIALAVGAAGGARLTETGLSLGTPYYMSPEQATGDQQVGPTSDIYSLGAVLYEMLVGEPPFTGRTAQAVLGKIIQGSLVTATQIRKSVPANVDGAVRKALEKLPADRFTQVQDFAHALTDPSFRHGPGGGSGLEGDVRRWKRMALGCAAGLVLVAAWSAWRTWSPAPEPPRLVARFSSPFEPGQAPVAIPGFSVFSLSPDGAALVYRGLDRGDAVLFVRRWADVEATPIQDSRGGEMPSVSPDGQEVVFTAIDPNVQNFSLRVSPLQGGVSRELFSDTTWVWARWGRDGYVYFRTDSSQARMDPRGGEIEEILPDREGTGVRLWDVLPDHRTGLGWEVGPDGIHLSAIHLADGQLTRLGPQGMIPQYVDPGYLLYWAPDSTLMAAPFDAKELKLTGDPIPLVRGLWDFDVTDSGTLFYWGPRPRQTIREFVWVSRAGQLTPVDPGWTFDAGQSNVGWSLSPDGRRLAYRERRDGNYDIWVKELDAGPLSRLTFHRGEERMPRWTSDGDSVTFLSSREGSMDAYVKAADGTGDTRPLFNHTVSLAQAVYGPKQEWLVLRTGGQSNIAGGRDILAVRPGVDSVATPLLMGRYDEAAPALSPDGRWLAYGSRETGTWEVYVRPFPEVDAGKWQVSVDGGVQPTWSRDGRELFFINPDREMMAARYETAAGFRVVETTRLFAVPSGIAEVESAFGGKYDVTPDGQRFLMARELVEDEDAPADEWILVLNFVDEVRRALGG